MGLLFLDMPIISLLRGFSKSEIREQCRNVSALSTYPPARAGTAAWAVVYGLKVNAVEATGL
jgi:hypothetical protein